MLLHIEQMPVLSERTVTVFLKQGINMKLLQLTNHKAKLVFLDAKLSFSPEVKRFTSRFQSEVLGTKSITTSFETLPRSAATSSGKQHKSL